ncbi:hypothetical protein N7519_010044 [Penicillium mononematosum]|uniref:uncharacterized protein n=1 Tax=Penicillium mononematosum TaxID=268346 RepID=UPI00254944B4|nr:uncharacterized protein N7519_010044 [Penicillium mononematosum]KAJ6179583.1 hypothetical protein N7519_010044 [Penicillium mononematosum]
MRLGTRASINDCGDSTFINQSTGGSPLVADCQHLARNIAGGGTWKVTFTDSQHQLAQYGTCAFGIEGDNPMNTAYVGNQDIIDVINTSIAKFQWEGKIGTKGTMACQSQKGIMGTPLMTWGTITTEPQL